jgi:hypothetical protein
MDDGKYACSEYILGHYPGKWLFAGQKPELIELTIWLVGI